MKETDFKHPPEVTSAIDRAVAANQSLTRKWEDSPVEVQVSVEMTNEARDFALKSYPGTGRIDKDVAEATRLFYYKLEQLVEAEKTKVSRRLKYRWLTFA